MDFIWPPQLRCEIHHHSTRLVHGWLQEAFRLRQIAKVQPLTANPFRPKSCSVINVDTITSASSYSLCCRQFVIPFATIYRSSIRSLQHLPKPLGTAPLV